MASDGTPVLKASKHDPDARADEGKVEVHALSDASSSAAGSPRFSAPSDTDLAQPVVYKLYRRRFLGALAVCVLNVFAGMCWPWFGPISNNMVADFGITLDQVNWLGNVMALVYLPVSIAVPYTLGRLGLRSIFLVGAVCLLIGAWIRYAGTVHSLSPNGAYALLLIGQLFASVAQPIFQVLGPRYSEVWFDLKGRTTATMLFSIANPIGGALGQVISPLVGSSRESILVLGIVCTVASPFALLIQSRPPTPPTYAGSKTSPPLKDTLWAWIGRSPSAAAYMSLRERIDFAILVLIFGVLVGATNDFAILSDEILQPYGYSSDTAGFMGAALLLSGIVAAIITAPLFDRVLTHHLGLTARVLSPILGAGWLATVWVIKPDNTGAVYAVLVVVGVTAVTMLPVGLELGCELTRNADGSSALLWFAGNLMNFIFILVEDALRAGPEANPPLNMHRAVIFNAAFVCAAVSTIAMFRGKQVRREMDEEKNKEAAERQGDVDVGVLVSAVPVRAA